VRLGRESGGQIDLQGGGELGGGSTLSLTVECMVWTELGGVVGLGGGDYVREQLLTEANLMKCQPSKPQKIENLI
jgi:hypothetical protein